MPLGAESKGFSACEFKERLVHYWNYTRLQTYSYTTDFTWTDSPNANNSHFDLEDWEEQDVLGWTAKAGLLYRPDINTQIIIGAAIPIVALDSTGQLPKGFDNFMVFRETEFGISFTYTFK